MMVIQDFNTGNMFRGQVPGSQCVAPAQSFQSFHIEITDSPTQITDFTILRHGDSRNFFQRILQRLIPLAYQGGKIEPECISYPCHHRGTDNCLLQLRYILF